MVRHLLMTSLLIVTVIQTYNVVHGVDYDRALFVKSEDIRKARELHTKVSRIAPNSMDQTVDHILMWLQSRYQQNQRQARQNTEPQRPRPFVAPQQAQEFRGYLPPQPPPQPEFSIPQQLNPAQQSSTSVDNNQFFQAVTTSEPESPSTEETTPNSQAPSFSQIPNFSQASSFSQGSSFTQQTTTFSNEPSEFLATNPPLNTNAETLQTDLTNVVHPPHIHEMTVQCSKDMMTINVEFNRPYDGVIYSKGFYNNPECRYVTPNSGQTKYSFKVMLNSCGTHFVDEFSSGKQAYLENVLVVQNEPGIQEVWDVIRSVRCLWEGNLNKALSIALNIGTLNQEVVTFSGDTATARLDIQAGKGPFAPIANGLVKIGETMTLVVTVDGDPGFNVLVRECIARDNDPNSGNQLQLTDSQGCVAKPKLFGSFQTTTNPATGSLIAYAYFQAFKFPDVMDLLIECNVELCKVNCQPCGNSNQKIDPGRRRRRDVHGNNTVNASNSNGDTDSMMLIGRVHVYSPDDLLADNFNQTGMDLVDPFQSFTSTDRTLCMSSRKFYFTYSFMVAMTLISSAISMTLWIRLQRKAFKV
ncbi:uncharacterized protein LOC126895442 [Daktulosphaira vitifoliae]|uniref:uncharacterized protein LOC126895442 n=1 Tax=Daktulosphaira vitifoliae TaxID=58002 RepID=UPI0021A9D83D|nr:uncharacterized protein LOC126895442 [Daktulosphaira vitifoliae]